jgi:hypothetical protein
MVHISPNLRLRGWLRLVISIVPSSDHCHKFLNYSIAQDVCVLANMKLGCKANVSNLPDIEVTSRPAACMTETFLMAHEHDFCCINWN